MGLGHLIQAHLCYGDTLTSKGQTILRLLRENNITNTVYIGDTQGDYQAATAAGLPFIWATYGFGVPESYIAKVDHFPQLLEIL